MAIDILTESASDSARIFSIVLVRRRQKVSGHSRDDRQHKSQNNNYLSDIEKYEKNLGVYAIFRIETKVFTWLISARRTPQQGYILESRH